MSGTIGRLVSLSYANFVLPETGSCVSPRSQLTVASGAAVASLMLPWWKPIFSQSMVTWSQALKMRTLQECIA